MKQTFTHIVLAIAFAIIPIWNTNAQSDVDLATKVSKQIQLMRESKSADDIYTVRTRIENLAESAPKDVRTLGIFREAYLVMADRLATHDHYKSGCNAYFKYLELEEAYHEKYMVALRDSAGTNTTPNPTPEPQPVVKDKEPVQEDMVIPSDTVVSDSSDLASQGSGPVAEESDNTIWIVVLISLVIIFGVMTFSQRKRISKLNLALSSEQTEVKRLFRISATVSMISGVIRYAREFSSHCAEVLIDMVETIKSENSSKNNSENHNTAPADEAISIFKKISSGGKSVSNGNIDGH
ncbi:MAG: hypothetical protein RL090_1145 [Bacteroidota bacterium]